MNRLIISLLPYEIYVSEEGYPALRVTGGSEWTDADTISSDLMLLERIVEMHKLLHAVNEATGPGACERQLPDALTDINNFLDKINK
jgi:hypothetical protein